MATKPTRQQVQAGDRLAEALLSITEAARLDGGGKFDLADLTEVADRLTNASSAFDRVRIISRALEERGRVLGLRSGTADLLLLMEGDITPLAMLLLPDAEFRDLVETMEAELGDV